MATLGRNMLQQTVNPYQMVQNAHMVCPRNHRLQPAPALLARADLFRRLIAAATAATARRGHGEP